MTPGTPVNFSALYRSSPSGWERRTHGIFKLSYGQPRLTKPTFGLEAVGEAEGVFCDIGESGV